MVRKRSPLITQHLCGSSNYVLSERTTPTQLLAQDETYAHRQNFYIKSAFESNPTFDVVNNLVEKLNELNAAPGNVADHGYMFELFPTDTGLYLSEDAIAHLRAQRYTTGCIIKWKNSLNTPSVKQAAKRAAPELTDIVAKAEGTKTHIRYGNYSDKYSEHTLASRSHVFIYVPVR
jgi:hypothetical protein